MFKPMTIANYLMKIDATMKAMLSNIDNLNVCISAGNRKIGNSMNVSLAPIWTCGHNCKVCKGDCYDIKACVQYGNVLNARARNTVLAMHDRDRFFQQIDAKMSRRRKNKVFRWHVGGDIPDMNYFERMIENAKAHPDFIVWTYTKQYHIVNEYVRTHGGSIETAIPQNMSIMYSVWDGLECDNPYGFATFTCVDESRGDKWPEHTHHCNGACGDCINGHTGCPFRKSSAVAKH